MNISISSHIRCLLVSPKLNADNFSFWSFRETCRVIGAKALMPPLGLITMAALLPDNWSIKLADLNTSHLDREDWDWADIIFVGGMIPQQGGILEIIQR